MSEQIQKTRRPTHIATISSLQTLNEFVEKLEGEFSMTNFDLLKLAIKPSPYSYNLDCRMEEEGSYNHIASQEVESYKSPTNKPTSTNTIFKWEWDTSSNHYVRLEGEIPGEHIDKIDVSFYIGTDSSKGFYPAVKDIIKGLGVPIF
jgi:hypothetical protein